MATGYLLIDKPNRNYPQYRSVRRNGRRPTGTVVIHTYEWPWKRGADPAADWLTERDTPGSYHRLVDWADIIRLAPWSYEVWHDTSTNNHSVGISAAVAAADWKRIPEPYRTQIVRNMAIAAADFASWMFGTYGVTVPARTLTRAEAHAGVPGFIGHGRTGPGKAGSEPDWYRRTDPGEDFDWELFFTEYRNALNPETAVGGTTHIPTPEEDELMAAADDILAEIRKGRADLAKVHTDVVAARNHSNTAKIALGDFLVRVSGVDFDALDSGGEVKLSEADVDTIASALHEKLPTNYVRHLAYELERLRKQAEGEG